MFGDYVSTYDFQRAVEDGATVPLYYDARGDDLGVAIDDLNERIADKLEELEIDDIDVAQRLERELKRDYHVVTAGRRLDQVARDFVHHYSAAWETGKAMLVCIDKVTCVRMHALIERYWDERIKELEAEHATGARASRRRSTCKRQIDWMRETRAAVVVSEEQGEVEKFRRGISTSFLTGGSSRRAWSCPRRCAPTRGSATGSGWPSTTRSRSRSTRSASPSSAPCG